MPTIEERLARLEKAAEPEGKSEFKPSAPLPSFDPSAQLTMPPNVMKAMASAFDPQAVANDHLGKPTSLPGVHGRSRGKAGENYLPERPKPTWGNENWPRKKEG